MSTTGYFCGGGAAAVNWLIDEVQIKKGPADIMPGLIHLKVEIFWLRYCIGRCFSILEGLPIVFAGFIVAALDI